MADEQDVLSARLEVKDSFTSQMDKFINATNKAESAFDKFINGVDLSAKMLEKTLDVIESKLSSVTTKVIAQTDTMTNKITSSASKVEQAQNKSIDDMTKKYTQMGTNVQNVFKNINKDAETLSKSGVKLNVNGGSSNNENHNNHSHSNSFLSGNTDYALTSLMSGDFSMMLMNLGVIGAGIMGTSKILTTIEGWLQQGYNVLNTLSGNLLSVQGIQQGLQTAGEFEQNRVAMNVLYGNNEALGQQYYSMGTYLAKKTPYSEKDVGDLQKKLAGAKINYTQDQLMTLLDVASIKPELGAEHVGFSLVDAMAGRSTSLKTNYMLDNKEINKYLQSLKKTNPTNYVQWKDAFSKTGTVNNRQEYLDLLVDYVKNETKYSGLTDKYSKTMNGLIDRIKGNWETIEASIIGIDANNTGTAKQGINVFNSVKGFIDYMDDWLNSSNASAVFNGLGEGLGNAVDSVAKAVEGFMSKIDWNKVGGMFSKMGESIAKIVDTLANSPQFEQLLDKLPALVDTTLKNQVIDTKTKVSVGADLASGNYFDAFKAWGQGFDDKIANMFGFSNTMDKMHNAQDYVESGSWLTQFARNPDSITYLTKANASTYLEQNTNLTDDQRNQIKDMINKDNQTIYHITIGEIKADNFDEIVDSIQKIQNNQK